MKKKTIGILGASGLVGRGAVESILDSTNCHLLLGGRNREKLKENFPLIESRGEFCQLNIFDLNSLHQFCRKCDVVLNCAGPSKQIWDQVASVCIEERVHYVDVSGDENLYRQLIKRKWEIEEHKLVFIIGAGVYPGLSEIFPAYVADTYFDQVDVLELFFAGQGRFSFNASYDIVCSIEDDTGLGMTYCNYGEAQKITGSFHSRFKLPLPAGELDTYPILSEEFRRVAARYGMKKAYFYNTYPSKSVLNQFMMIKALQQYKTEEQKKASAKVLSEQFDSKRNKKDDFTMFHLIAKGSKNGDSIQLVSNLLYTNDWNRLSGITTGNIARLLIEGYGERFGCFFAAEAINVTKLMENLSKSTLEHKLTWIE